MQIPGLYSPQRTGGRNANASSGLYKRNVTRFPFEEPIWSGMFLLDSVFAPACDAFLKAYATGHTSLLSDESSCSPFDDEIGATMLRACMLQSQEWKSGGALNLTRADRQSGLNQRPENARIRAGSHLQDHESWLRLEAKLGAEARHEEGAPAPGEHAARWVTADVVGRRDIEPAASPGFSADAFSEVLRSARGGRVRLHANR